MDENERVEKPTPKHSTRQLVLQPLAYGAKSGLAADGDPSEKFSTLVSPKSFLYWNVRLVDHRSRTRLATGGELSKLPGSVRVSIGNDPETGGMECEGGLARGMLHWLEEFTDDFDYEPEDYQAELYVTQRTFERLHTHAAAGLLPEVVIDVDGRGIRAGWEPDGSGRDWDNKEHPSVEIAWFRFDYPLNKPEQDDGDTGHAEVVVVPEPPLTSAQFSQGIEKLLALGKELKSAVWWVAALVAAVLIFK